MSIMHDRIKEMRYKRGLTLMQVAEHLNVTEATAQRYETGKGIKTIPYKTIEKYANLFGCTPNYLMGWDDAAPSDNLYSFAKQTVLINELNSLINKLNDDGIKKLIERAEELNEVARYRK